MTEELKRMAKSSKLKETRIMTPQPAAAAALVKLLQRVGYELLNGTVVKSSPLYIHTTTSGIYETITQDYGYCNDSRFTFEEAVRYFLSLLAKNPIPNNKTRCTFPILSQEVQNCVETLLKKSGRQRSCLRGNFPLEARVYGDCGAYNITNDLGKDKDYPLVSFEEGIKLLLEENQNV